MSWKQGPLPLNTYNWGGIVKVGENPARGFYFADFCGSHAKLVSGEIVPASAILMYDNSLELPPELPKIGTYDPEQTDQATGESKKVDENYDDVIGNG